MNMAWDDKEKGKIYWQKVKHKYSEQKKLKYASNEAFRNEVLLRHKKWIEDNPEKYRAQIERGRAKSLKKRFAILSRDKFTCQYCGRKPPEVVLEIDHIHPKSQGGKDGIGNLVTACRECNSGKRDSILHGDLLESLFEQLGC